jgi:prepilin-type N-terminal cleavage/methylation domain-containing protein
MIIIKSNLKNKTQQVSQKGFSFIEMIVSLSLLAMISSLTFFSFNSLNNKQSLDKQVDFIKSSINQTRVNAMNSKNAINQIINFSTTSITYDGKTINLENGISLSSYSTATNTISFSRISGFPNATGTIIYKLQKGNTVIATSSIIINNLGIIE